MAALVADMVVVDMVVVAKDMEAADTVREACVENII
jgi:hypothetical protein